MGNDTKNGSKVIDIDEMGLFETVKQLYLDWLRFFRANMRCGWECPEACPLDGECPEIERVWNLWLETLDFGDKALLSNN